MAAVKLEVDGQVSIVSSQATISLMYAIKGKAKC